jgi:G6PDH family F420-dependent oxidoreductase
MTIVGWHASHEQIAPSELLRSAVRAEEVGFDAGMSSDHFAPWSERQGQSGYAWSWLGAALASTSLGYGIVTAPGQRYHPAITAQAIATLLEMFPDRLWVALGSGEFANEHITGGSWPDKPSRNARLAECVEIMRALFDGDAGTSSSTGPGSGPGRPGDRRSSARPCRPRPPAGSAAGATG